MASFTASTGTLGLKLNLYPSGYAGHKLCENMFSIGISERNQRKVRWSNLTVQAMGGVAKFRGTQMREKKLTEMIENKVMEATEVCEVDRSSDECKVAWGEVEEVSQAKAHLRRKLEREDPLESFCQGNPEIDECSVYDD